MGNKCDLEEERQVTQEEGENMAAHYNAIFFEVSAKTDVNINEVCSYQYLSLHWLHHYSCFYFKIQVFTTLATKCIKANIAKNLSECRSHAATLEEENTSMVSLIKRLPKDIKALELEKQVCKHYCMLSKHTSLVRTSYVIDAKRTKWVLCKRELTS